MKIRERAIPLQNNGENGAIFVELAIGLPLFLAIIFFVLWAGTAYNSKASFISALSNAPRLAATRGNPTLAGGPIIRAVNEFLRTDSFAPLRGILYTAGTDPTEYNTTVEPLGLSNLWELDNNPEYIYTLIYLNESMRLSVGPSLRFPCDPNNTAGNDPKNGAGCIMCKFIDPLTIVAATDAPYMIGIECEYQPDTYLLTPLLRMISLVTGNLNNGRIILKGKKYFMRSGVYDSIS